MVAWFCLAGTAPQLWVSVGTDVMCEQSLKAEIVLKNHLVDFITICHLDALLIRVQQALLTTRIGNKGIC